MTQLNRILQRYNTSGVSQISRYSLDEDTLQLMDQVVTSYLLETRRLDPGKDSLQIKRTARLCKLLAHAHGASRVFCLQIENAVMLFSWGFGLSDEYAGLSTLEMAQRIQREYGERWDGQGYYHGYSGENISLETRIFQICNAYIRLISRDDGKGGSPRSQLFADALDTLHLEAGKRYDPELVQLLHDDVVGEFACAASCQ